MAETRIVVVGVHDPAQDLVPLDILVRQIETGGLVAKKPLIARRHGAA